MPPRNLGWVLEVSTGRDEAHGDGVWSGSGAHGMGCLDGPLDGSWTPPRAVEGPVQVTHAQNFSSFAFFALCFLSQGTGYYNISPLGSFVLE